VLRLIVGICYSIIFLAMTGILVGCAPREIPPRYFVATSIMERTSAVPPEDDVRKVVPWAGSLLKSGKATVAFLPPDWCTFEKDAENRRVEMEKKVCLTLAAALENRAAENGYRVVDWRRLKTDPYGVAKQEQIDALFVIDELSVQTPSADHFSVTHIDFTEQVFAERRAPVEIGNQKSVTARCMGAEKARQRRNADQTMVTGASLSLKMVSATDGTTMWFYRHGSSRKSSLNKTTADYYYLSEGSKKTKKDKLAWGIVAASLGIAAAVAGAHLNDHGTSLAQRNIGFGLAWASVVPLTAGIAMTTVGLVSVLKRPVYESPDDVICARPPFFDNPLASQSADENRTDQGMGDLENKEPESPEIAQTDVSPSRSMIVDEIADHFFAAMQQLSLDRAVAPPPPPAPPPLQETAASPEEAPRIVIIERGKDKEETDGRKRGRRE
jgi:hypothetical protein